MTLMKMVLYNIRVQKVLSYKVLFVIEIKCYDEEISCQHNFEDFVFNILLHQYKSKTGETMELTLDREIATDIMVNLY